MTLENMKEKAPESGMLYGVYKDRIQYEPYKREELTVNVSENLLELHLFDDDKEYRFVRMKGGTAEWLISDGEWELLAGTGRCKRVHSGAEYDDIYEETVYITPNNPDRSDGFKANERMTVVNYIAYDENDMIRMKNYRYSTRQGERKV